jgi:WD repeat-containing protein 19
MLQRPCVQVLDVLSDAAYAPSLARIALAGSNSVRIMDASGSEFNEIKSDAVELDPGQVGGDALHG